MFQLNLGRNSQDTSKTLRLVSFHLGKVVEKSAHCCGHQLYNTQDEICCQDVIIIKKNKTSDDTCCTSQEKPVPYDQDSQRCTEKGVVNKVCGAAVTPETDLCCGEETLIKNGRNQGMDCCGKNPYFLANQTCDYLSKTVTRRRYVVLKILCFYV